MHNTEIREAIQRFGLKYWEVAERVGIADTTLTKWLRRELSDERRSQVLAAIDELKKEKGYAS